MDKLKKRNADLHPREDPKKQERGQQSSLSGLLNRRLNRRELLKAGAIAGLGLATLGTVPRQAFGQAARGH